MAAKAKKEEVRKFTKYEKARMIGSRAMQLSMGAPMTLKFTEKELEEIHYNPIEIAKREFDAGTIPLKVLEPLKRVIVEDKKEEAQ